MNASDLTAEQRRTIRHAADMGGWLTDSSGMSGASDAADMWALVRLGVFEHEAEPHQVPRFVLTDDGRKLADQLDDS